MPKGLTIILFAFSFYHLFFHCIYLTYQQKGFLYDSNLNIRRFDCWIIFYRKSFSTSSNLIIMKFSTAWFTLKKEKFSSSLNILFIRFPNILHPKAFLTDPEPAGCLDDTSPRFRPILRPSKICFLFLFNIILLFLSWWKLWCDDAWASGLERDPRDVGTFSEGFSFLVFASQSAIHTTSSERILRGCPRCGSMGAALICNWGSWAIQIKWLKVSVFVIRTQKLKVAN